MQDEVSVFRLVSNETTEFYNLRLIDHPGAISQCELLDWHVLPANKASTLSFQKRKELSPCTVK